MGFKCISNQYFYAYLVQEMWVNVPDRSMRSLFLINLLVRYAALRAYYPCGELKWMCSMIDPHHKPSFWINFINKEMILICKQKVLDCSGPCDIT